MNIKEKHKLLLDKIPPHLMGVGGTTPIELAEKLIERVKPYIDFSSPKFTFADIACGFGTFGLVVSKEIQDTGNSSKGKIYLNDISKFKCDIVEKKVVTDAIVSNEDYLTMVDDRLFMFGLINPPYFGKSSKDLQFILKLFPKIEEVLGAIHRSNYLLSGNETPNSVELEMRKLVEEHYTEIHLLDGNKYFSKYAKKDMFPTPLALTSIFKRKSPDIVVTSEYFDTSVPTTYTSVSDINIHVNPIADRIRKKIQKINKVSLLDMSTRNKRYKNKKGYYVTFPALGGHPPKEFGKVHPDCYALVTKENEFNPEKVIFDNYDNLPGKRDGGTGKRGIWVGSKQEAYNLFETMKSKFYRIAFSFEKIGLNIWSGSMLKSIPYLDYTQEWNDEKLYELADFNDEDKEYLENFLGKWYESD